MKRNIFLLLFLLLLPVGCVPKNISAYDGLSGAYPSATEQVAQQAAIHLASVYPPGQTILALDTRSSFGQALDRNLRERGFGISANGVPLKYQLDIVKGEMDLCYLSMRLPEGTITQSYVLHGGKIVPGSLAMTGLPPYVARETRSPEVQSTPLDPGPSGYILEAYKGASGDVFVTVKKDGHPQAGIPIRFEASSAYPNLRTVGRKTDGNGQVALRKLHIRDGSEPLRAVVAGQSVLCSLEPSSTPAPAPAVAVSPSPALAPVALTHVQPAPPPAPATASAAVYPALEPALSAAPAPAAIPYLPAPQERASTPVQPAVATAPAAASSPSPEPTLAVPAPGAGVTSFIPAVQEKPLWVLHAGMLRSQLQRWGTTEGYQIIWSAQNDFDLETGAEFEGDFVTVIRQLFSQLHDQGMPLRVTIYQSHRVVTVSED
jgi:hypothetical protein